MGASTTKAGLQRFIAENPHKEIIITDEIDKMPLKDQEGLLGMSTNTLMFIIIILKK